jgi:Protein of unknown function (DUF3617)
MTRFSIAALAVTALLAGCGAGDVELKNASVEDVVKATANAQALTPGQWSTTTEIVSVDMPGMPEKEKSTMMAAMSKAMIGKKNVAESCVTPEQAKKPNAAMFAGADSGNCTFESFSMANGRMDAVMKCAAPGRPGEMKMTMGGKYGGDTYELASEINMSGMTGAPGNGAMTIKANNSGKRVGECKPS